MYRTLVVVVCLILPGCRTEIQAAFPCGDDGDCGDGWECLRPAGEPEGVCVPPGYGQGGVVPDVVEPADVEPDTTCEGDACAEPPDAEPPDADPDAGDLPGCTGPECPDAPPPAGCGDGVVDPGEQCDEASELCSGCQAQAAPLWRLAGEIRSLQCASGGWCTVLEAGPPAACDAPASPWRVRLLDDRGQLRGGTATFAGEGDPKSAVVVPGAGGLVLGERVLGPRRVVAWPVTPGEPEITGDPVVLSPPGAQGDSLLRGVDTTHEGAWAVVEEATTGAERRLHLTFTSYDLSVQLSEPLGDFEALVYDPAVVVAVEAEACVLFTRSAEAGKVLGSTCYRRDGDKLVVSHPLTLHGGLSDEVLAGAAWPGGDEALLVFDGRVINERRSVQGLTLDLSTAPLDDLPLSTINEYYWGDPQGIQAMALGDGRALVTWAVDEAAHAVHLHQVLGTDVAEAGPHLLARPAIGTPGPAVLASQAGAGRGLILAVGPRLAGGRTVHGYPVRPRCTTETPCLFSQPEPGGCTGPGPADQRCVPEGACGGSGACAEGACEATPLADGAICSPSVDQRDGGRCEAGACEADDDLCPAGDAFTHWERDALGGCAPVHLTCANGTLEGSERCLPDGGALCDNTCAPVPVELPPWVAPVATVGSDGRLLVGGRSPAGAGARVVTPGTGTSAGPDFEPPEGASLLAASLRFAPEMPARSVLGWVGDDALGGVAVDGATPPAVALSDDVVVASGEAFDALVWDQGVLRVRDHLGEDGPYVVPTGTTDAVPVGGDVDGEGRIAVLAVPPDEVARVMHFEPPFAADPEERNRCQATLPADSGGAFSGVFWAGEQTLRVWGVQATAGCPGGLVRCLATVTREECLISAEDPPTTPSFELSCEALALPDGAEWSLLGRARLPEGPQVALLWRHPRPPEVPAAIGVLSLDPTAAPALGTIYAQDLADAAPEVVPTLHASLTSGGSGVYLVFPGIPASPADALAGATSQPGRVVRLSMSALAEALP